MHHKYSKTQRVPVLMQSRATVIARSAQRDAAIHVVLYVAILTILIITLDTHRPSMLYSAAMTNAARTSGLPNPSTGEMRLLDVARWLIAILVVHFIIVRARVLAAALHKPYGPDDAFLAHFFGTTDRDRILARMTSALSRAAALEHDLLARRPTEHGFSTETRSAYAAQIIDICRALGIIPAKPTVARAKTACAHPTVGAGLKPAPTIRMPVQRPATTACPGLRAGATGPPAIIHRGDAEIIPPARVYPWSFSRRAPALFSSYTFS